MAAKYRKVACRIWQDPTFEALSVARKIEVIEAIVRNKPPLGFEEFCGPSFRIREGQPKRRPDLYSADWRRVRLEVIAEQGTVCAYCGCDCSEDPTVDHKVPVSRGGTHCKTNLVVSCRPCNSQKGGMEGWL